MAIHALDSVYTKAYPLVDVRHPDFGAVLDGVNDNGDAVRAAAEAANAQGGGIVYIPGDCKVTSVHPDAPISGINFILRLTYDNVYIWIPAGGRLWTDQARRLIAAGGWWDGDIHSRTLYDLTGTYTYGDTSVTLNTVAEAGNFSVDDWIYVRTGQTTAAAGSNQPFAEWNKVLTADAGTGVIELQWPLQGDYAQENYPAGHPDSGNPAPYGVHNGTTGTKVITEHSGIYGAGILESQAASQTLLSGNQAAYFYEGGVGGTLTVKSGHHHHSAGWSYSVFENMDIFLNGTGASFWPLTMDKGNVGSVFRNMRIYARELATVHLHEGCQAEIRNFRILNNHASGTPSSLDNTISMDARPRGTVLDGITIIGTNDNASVPDVHASVGAEGQNYANNIHVIARNGEVGVVSLNGTWATSGIKADTFVGGSHQYGSATVTPDGSGNDTITHNLKEAPNFVSVGIRGDNVNGVDVQSVDATDITVRVKDAAGADVTAGSFTVDWEARV